MTPFTRLALLTGTTLYALGLAAAALYLSVHVAVFVFVVGGVLAIVMTFELAPRAAASPDVAKQEEQVERPIVARTRADIERSAREARDEE